MKRSMKPFAAFILIGAVAVTGTVSAQSRTIQLPPRVENISGVSVTFKGQAVLTPRACSSLDASIRVSLADLAAKGTRIIKSGGMEKNEQCGDKIRIHTATMTPSGSNLAIKVTGNVARQECIKTKVPVFKGLKMYMENKIVGSTTLDTNASVAATFDPVVVNGGRALRMKLISGPTTRVSNDVAKFLISVFGFDSKIDHKMREAVTKTIGRNDAMLKLPPDLVKRGIVFRDARIEKGPTLVVDGNVPLPAGMEALTLSLMGYETEACSG